MPVWPLPDPLEGFTTVTVMGTLSNPDGSPVPDTAFSWLPLSTVPLTDGGRGYIVANRVTGVTDSNGQFSVLLVANDDPTTNPQESAYVFSATLASGVVASRTYVIHASMAPLVDIGTLVAV